MNNLLTADQVKNLGIGDKYIGAKYRYQYQKTGGIIVCPKCGKFLGFPKHSGGVIVKKEGENIPICHNESCIRIISQTERGSILDFEYPQGVVKYAVNATNVHCKTTIVLKTIDGEIFTATVKLNKDDVYDKRIARQYAFEKLIGKLK